MYADKLSQSKATSDYVEGFVLSIEECMPVLKQYELESMSRFVCTKRPSKFGKQGRRTKKPKEAEKAVDHDYKRKKHMVQCSKKVDCPATVHIREVFCFPKYKVDQPTEWKMKATSKTLRSLLGAPLDNDVSQLGEWRYYLRLPTVTQHKNHFTSEQCEVINSYLQLLQRIYNHVFVFPSYLAVLWDNSKFDTWLCTKVQLQNFIWLFVPVNVSGIHWALLAAHVPSQTISVVDSLSMSAAATYVDKWRTFMSLRSGKVSELDSWSTGSLTSVRQADSCSCGPFVLLNATCLAMGIPLASISNKHAIAMRRYVLKQVLEAATVPPCQREICDAAQCTNKDKQATWVCCDACGRWCHVGCVNVTEAPAGDFICPMCHSCCE